MSIDIEKLEAEGNVDKLIEALQHKDSTIRRDSAAALGILRDPRAVNPLIPLLNDANQTVRKAAIAALSDIGGETAVRALIGALKDTDSENRALAALAIGYSGNVHAIEPLSVALLNDADDSVREHAARALGNIGDTQAEKPLKAALRDRHQSVRIVAQLALEKLSGSTSSPEDFVAALRGESHTRLQSRYFQCPYCESVMRKDDHLYEMSQNTLMVLSDDGSCPACKHPLSPAEVYGGKYDVPANDVLSGKHGIGLVQGLWQRHSAGMIHLTSAEIEAVQIALNIGTKPSSASPATRSRRWLWMVGVVLVIVIVIGGYLMLRPSQSRTLTGHSREVTSVAFSPDGRYALSGSYDETMRLWDVETGATVSVFADAGHVDRVAFSPNGRYVLSSSSSASNPLVGILRLWDVETGKMLRVFEGHTGDVTSVAFSPEGRYVLSGSSDKTMRLWNVETSEILHTFDHFGEVTGVAFSPDGRYALSSSESRLRLWNIVTSDLIWALQAHAGSIRSVAFSPDGRYAVSGSADQTVRLWDIDGEISSAYDQDGKIVHIMEGHTYTVENVAFSADGHYIFSSASTNFAFDKNEIRIWNTETGEHVRTLHGNSGRHGVITSLASSPNGRYLLSGSKDGTLTLWNVSDLDIGVAPVIKSVDEPDVEMAPIEEPTTETEDTRGGG